VPRQREHDRVGPIRIRPEHLGQHVTRMPAIMENIAVHVGFLRVCTVLQQPACPSRRDNEEAHALPAITTMLRSAPFPQRMHDVPPVPEPKPPPAPKPPSPKPDVEPPDIEDPPPPEHPGPVREPRTPPPAVAA